MKTRVVLKLSKCGVQEIQVDMIRTFTNIDKGRPKRTPVQDIKYCDLMRGALDKHKWIKQLEFDYKSEKQNR